MRENVSAPITSKILNSAVSQRDRKLGAPAPETFQPDARTLPQLLDFATQYGRLIRFYDLNNIPHGDWSEFFATGPTSTKAAHAALDLPEIEQGLRALLALVRAEIDLLKCALHLRRIFRAIVRLVSVLGGGIEGQDDPEADLKGVTRTVRRDSLAEPLRSLRLHFGDRSLEDCLAHHRHDRARRWLNTLIALLEDTIASVVAELTDGMEAAEQSLLVALNASGQAPQTALYNAFATLFAKARGRLNRFPRRFIDFYYGEMLEQDSRDAVPSEVFLSFTTAAGVLDASVPKGPVFSAGTSADGQAIGFAADTSLDVTAATVEQMSVQTAVGITGPGQAPTSMWTGNVVFSPSPPRIGAAFPLFGAGRVLDTGSLAMQQATLGFCIVSPVLMLSGGSRRIDISLNIQLVGDPIDGLEPGSDAGSVTDLETIISKSFSIHYSTADGWMTVPSQSIKVGQENVLTVSIVLPADAPPLVPLSTKPEADAPAPSLPASAFAAPKEQPAIVFSLRPEITEAKSERLGLNPFAILPNIGISALNLNVTVTGLSELSIPAPSGPADMTADFPVLGLIPAKGSALSLYAPELFVKRLKTLSLSIAWAGLPVTTGGFKGYYKGYALDANGLPYPPVPPTSQIAFPPLFDNTSFKVSLSVDNPGMWDIAKDDNGNATQFCLFQSDPGKPGETEPASGIASVSLLAGASVVSATPSSFYDPSTSALRMTLEAPDYAFGNTLYAANLNYASLQQIIALTPSGKASQSDSASARQARPALAATAARGKDDLDRMKASSRQTIKALADKAAVVARQAVAASGASPDRQRSWLTGLEDSLSNAARKSESFLTRRFGGKSKAGSDAMLATLKTWIARIAPEAGSEAEALLTHAGALLSAAEALTASLAATAGQSVATAMTAIDGALQQAEALIAGSGGTTSTVIPTLPNPPWQPIAAAVTIGYTASALLTPASQHATLADAANGTGDDRATPQGKFLYLRPFNQMAPPRATTEPADLAAGTAPPWLIIPHEDLQTALYIPLSMLVPAVSLLFILKAGPDGWSTEKPVLRWQQQIGTRWSPIEVTGDSTNGLMNSGIVTLRLKGTEAPGATPNLRVVLVSGMNNIPLLASVATNALRATWIGPGGAETLGIPIAPLTITQSNTPLNGIATIVQALESIGGEPRATGPDFHMWMAERLRHKGFGIDAWDYARLVLAAVPSLWQLAVVPATDSDSGEPAPGKIWLVAVAGRSTPNVDDPTIPQADPSVLASVGEAVRDVISPFIVLSVTNPPYCRITVHAVLVFDDADTPAAFADRLDTDLIKWLSPWPDPSLGPRPANYYTRHAIAEFIRGQPYVVGITSLEIVHDKGTHSGGWRYFTSALKHCLKGRTESTTPDLSIRPLMNEGRA